MWVALCGGRTPPSGEQNEKGFLALGVKGRATAQGAGTSAPHEGAGERECVPRNGIRGEGAGPTEVWQGRLGASREQPGLAEPHPHPVPPGVT